MQCQIKSIVRGKETERGSNKKKRAFTALSNVRIAML
jgi:hypothetical protein